MKYRFWIFFISWSLLAQPIKKFKSFFMVTKYFIFTIFFILCSDLLSLMKESAGLYELLHSRIFFSISNLPFFYTQLFIFWKFSTSFTNLLRLVFSFFRKILIPFMSLFLKPLFGFLYGLGINFTIWAIYVIWVM